MKVANSLAVFLLAVVTVFVHAQAQTTTSSNSISIEHPWARATFAGGKTGSAYLTIRNSGTSSDRLIEASTPLANKVQFHQENDADRVMRMREMPAVTIPPGASVILKPGGTHIMIIGLTRQLKAGQNFPLTLGFERAGKVDLRVPVFSAGAMGNGEMEHMQH